MIIQPQAQNRCWPHACTPLFAEVRPEGLESATLLLNVLRDRKGAYILNAVRIPKLLKQRLWEVSDWVVLCGGGVISLDVLVNVVFVDDDHPWLGGGRFVSGENIVNQLHDDYTG